jgi:hypothetical protein
LVALSLVLGGAPRARANTQLPHAEMLADGITPNPKPVRCADCHIPYGALADPSHLLTGLASSGTGATLVDSAKTWTAGAWVGGVVIFTAGTPVGADGLPTSNLGEQRTVVANDATSVTWSGELPFPVAAGGAYTLYKVDYSDIQVKCAVCHNPAGMASAHPSSALHQTGSAGSIGCGKCHDPHNLKDAAGNPTTSGWSGAGGGNLIRKDVRLPSGGVGAIVYTPGTNVQPAGNGICQVCHTTTAYYRNDGTRQGHGDGRNCAEAGCHGHSGGFQGTAALGMHLNASGAAWQDHNTAGPLHGWSQACQRCHTGAGFRDYVGMDGSDNHLQGTFNANGADYAYGFGPLACDTCHNAVSDPKTGTLTTVKFVTQKQVTTDHATALCAQCHQGRESTASLGTKLTANVAAASKGLGVVAVTATGAGTTTTIVKSGFVVDAYKGYTLLATNNLAGSQQNLGQQSTVTGNTATTITVAPAFPVATAAGPPADAFNLWPTATGGTTTTLIDANRAWTVDAWKDFYAFVQTGANAGLYRKIASNTATTLTLAGAFAVAPAAGDWYQILPKEDTTVLDAQLASGNSFTNPHYLGAAAMLFGADTFVPYQYPVTKFTQAATPMNNAIYAGQNLHGVSQGACTSCHNPHTLDVTVTASTCGRCHFTETGAPVATKLELEESRQFGFDGDFDGDGVVAGLKTEIDGLAAKLFAAMQAYATQVAGLSLCYSNTAYPYFFTDTNADGTCGNTGDASYNKFTPRLLRAAFNYKWYQAEPGAWAHNPRYMIELLWDGITDLNAGLTAKGFAAVPFSGWRASTGHFGAASAAFPMGGDQLRDWDSAVVPKDCSQCHAGQKGLENYLADPWTSTTNRPIAAMQCTTCHAPGATDTDMKALRAIAGVRFPPRSSAATGGQQVPIVKTAVDFADPADAVCASCHTGRESKASIDFKIGALTDASFTLGFTNPHYLGATSIMFGTEVKMAYEFGGKTYAGKKAHHGATASCVDCHDPRATRHTFEIAEAAPKVCATAGCHGVGNTAFAAYKNGARAGVDYDGNGTVGTLQQELDGLAAALYAQLRTSAAAPGAGGAICYSGSVYPYWFFDNGAGGGIAGDGICQAGETMGYNKFNPSLLRAAYNYQWYVKEPGAWAHNFDYMAQLLIDSVEALGGSVAGYTRP